MKLFFQLSSSIQKDVRMRLWVERVLAFYKSCTLESNPFGNVNVENICKTCKNMILMFCKFSSSVH